MKMFKNLKWPLSWNWTKPNNRSKTPSFHVMVCQIMMIHILVLGKLCDASEFRFTQRIKTSNGMVVGTTITKNSKPIATVWNGIPYAQPPIGNLRFRHPVPMDFWGYKPTTILPSKCIQPFDPDSDPDIDPIIDIPIFKRNPKYSEDCLYLNIHAPEPRDKRTPVLVYIHGSTFITSPFFDYDFARLASESNIIVVSIQHRGASLGFLSLGDDEIPGNAGLYDQKMALEWVKENIHNFGGDNKRITIYGQFAGAADVGLHLLSPLSMDLFSQAIMQSGSPLSNWATMSSRQGLMRSLKLAIEMGCLNRTTRLECLQNTPLDDLVRTENETFRAEGLAMPFVPMVDGTFIIQSPLESLKAGKFTKAKILTGVNMDESSVFLYTLLPEELKKLGNEAVNGTHFEASVRSLFGGINDMDLEVLKQLYRDGSDKYALFKMLSDRKITLPTLEFSKYASNGNDVFSFIFNQGPKKMPDWPPVKKNDLVNYVFGLPVQEFPPYKYNPEETDLSKRVMTLWGNFVKKGGPGCSNEICEETFHWPKYLPSDWKMVELKARLPNETDQIIINNFKASESATWKKIRDGL